MNTFTRRVVRGFLVVVMLSIGATVGAQTYPSRDITLIVPFVPGGGTDPIARQFAAQLEKALHGNVNVENKPGGSGSIGIGVTVRSKPDGHTIGIGTNASLTYLPLVNSGLAYKSPDDYQGIVKLSNHPILLFVRTDSPWKTFEEFIAGVKKNPGKIRVATAGFGTIADMAVHQFNKIAGVRLATVPLSAGSGEATIALLGSRVEAMTGGISSKGHVQAGTLRALAVFQKGKYEPFPTATSVIDAGYAADAALQNAYYVIGPKGMPKDVLDKLVAASLQAVRSEDFLKFGQKTGYVLDAKGPEGVKGELVEYGKMFSDLIKYSEKK